MNPFRRLTALFHRSRLDREMAEEIEAHVARETEQSVARGMTPAEARYAALRAFGGIEQIKEREREARGFQWLDHTWGDLRLASRTLLKSPGFTAIAVLSLALGIGACTAVFSVANGILLRSLPVPNPQQLRVLHWNGANLRISSWNGGDTSFTPPMFMHLREQASREADIFGFVPLPELIGQTGGESFSTHGAMVSDNYFAGLGVPPLVGRSLVGGDDFASAGTVVVLSHRLWQSHFASNPDVLGRTLKINGTPFTIVGILPRGFTGAQPGNPSDVFVPMASRSKFLYRDITSNFHWYVRVLARLKPEVHDAQFEAVLNTVWKRDAANYMDRPRIRLEAGEAGESIERSEFREPLLLMIGVVAVVMVIACANLGGLSLARGAARQHEFAIRAALGSGRARIVRLCLAETSLLAFAGGGLGLLLAIWLRNSMAHLLTGARSQLQYDFSIDWRVLVFALLIAATTALLAGLFPALQAGRVEPIDGLKNRGSLNAPRLRSGRVLVAAQTALAAMLIAAAMLFAKTVANLARIEPGFETDRLLLVRVNINGSMRAGTDPAGFYGRLQDALALLPGVRAASLDQFPLLSGETASGNFQSFSHAPEKEGVSIGTNRLTVGETFFSTLGIPIVLGRSFTAADGETAPKVAVVNEAFVRKYLPDRNPLGLTIPMWDADWQIVGVCRDVHYSTLKEPVPPTTYFPFRQRLYSRYRTSHLRSTYFAIRTGVEPLSLMPAIRRTLTELDPDVAIDTVTTQQEVRSLDAGPERLFASLCGSLAGLALLLACIGLYGLMAYNVARRTNEFGIRLALGASTKAVTRPILREAMVLVAVGLAIGLPAVAVISGVMRARLFGVEPNDPLTFVASAVLLLGFAALAAWMPARRAARVDPMIALRAE